MSTTAAAPADLFARPGWWDPGSRAYASLRAVTRLRLELLRDWLASWPAGTLPRTVVDLGCGGGLMGVPLALGGMRVLGVDRSAPALREAAARGARVALFVRADLQRLPLRDGCADLALLCDVLEHVDDVGAAVAAAARLLRSGGGLFVHTINRTLRARLLAVALGEGLGLIPRGTHDPRRFVRPQEVEALARAHGLAAERWYGERPRLWATLCTRTVQLRRGRSLAVGYAAGFRRMDG
jgi:2-polyprenyl-6-hydroxyphenyl methylase/3-demethylubiquinone-9 3-methyltransferase